MSAIEITRRGGFTSIFDWFTGPSSRRDEGIATVDAPWSGERADGGASACTVAVPGMMDAHALFARALRENSNQEQDWLWLSTMVTGEGELRYCLERALYINPHSEEARRELARLARHPLAPPPARWARRRPRCRPAPIATVVADGPADGGEQVSALSSRRDADAG